MTDLKAMTPHELLKRVEDRNRKFKMAAALFGIICLVGLVTLIIVSLSTLGGVKDQLASQKKLLDSQAQILSRISASSTQRTNQINSLQAHINCLLLLFQRPDREKLTIIDLESCRIDSNGAVSSDNTTVYSNGGSAPSSHNDTGSTVIINEGGATDKSSNDKPDTPSNPTDDNSSTLDRVPVLGRVFKALGL